MTINRGLLTIWTNTSWKIPNFLVFFRSRFTSSPSHPSSLSSLPLFSVTWLKYYIWEGIWTEHQNIINHDRVKDSWNRPRPLVCAAVCTSSGMDLISFPDHHYTCMMTWEWDYCRLSSWCIQLAFGRPQVWFSAGPGVPIDFYLALSISLSFSQPLYQPWGNVSHIEAGNLFHLFSDWDRVEERRLSSLTVDTSTHRSVGRCRGGPSWG